MTAWSAPGECCSEGSSCESKGSRLLASRLPPADAVGEGRVDRVGESIPSVNGFASGCRRLAQGVQGEGGNSEGDGCTAKEKKAEEARPCADRAARAETQDEYRDRIESHRLAQTCSICGKHLNYDDGCYTITHSHWECHEGERRHLERLMGIHGEGVALRRANGGWKVHAVDLRSGTALCGHEPAQRAFRMQQRGRWLPVSSNKISCGRCIEKKGKDTLNDVQDE